MRIVVFVAFLLVAFEVPTYGQDCSQILKYGVFDTGTFSSSTQRSSALKRYINRAVDINRQQSSSRNEGGAAFVPGYFDGDYHSDRSSNSTDSIERKLLRSMSQHSSSSETVDSAFTTASEVIALAWQRCISSMNERGLIVSFKMQSDDVFVFDLRYNPIEDGRPYADVAIKYPPGRSNGRCEPEQAQVGVAGSPIRCKRDNPADPFTVTIESTVRRVPEDSTYTLPPRQELSENRFVREVRAMKPSAPECDQHVHKVIRNPGSASISESGENVTIETDRPMQGGAYLVCTYKTATPVRHIELSHSGYGWRARNSNGPATSGSNRTALAMYVYADGEGPRGISTGTGTGNSVGRYFRRGKESGQAGFEGSAASEIVDLGKPVSEFTVALRAADSWTGTSTKLTMANPQVSFVQLAER